MNGVLRCGLRIGVATGTAVGAWWLTTRIVTPWQTRWGSTAEERTTALPGDELVAEPATQVTRAITVDAPAEAVWPWLVQIGADRGGFYSYDFLENIFGLGIHSRDEIVDEWQHLAVGDVVYASRNRGGGWYVVELRPHDTLALQLADLAAGRPASRDDKAGWEFLWTFALRAAGPDRTRLLVRERVAFGRASTRRLMAPVGFVSFVMTRRMMLGTKARAERNAPGPHRRSRSRPWADRAAGEGRIAPSPAPRPGRSPRDGFEHGEPGRAPRR